MVRPAFPGTMLALAATVVLVLVSVSTPIYKDIYFLSADLGVSVASVSLKGKVTLGVFGYCVEGIGSEAVCEGPRLGYELDSDQIFGNTTSIQLPNSLIKWLTIVLILNPVAAGLAGIVFILGVVAHFREFSTSRVTTWFASIATTVAMLAFIFDIVLFLIAKSRINAVSTDNVSVNAELGKAVWLALAGFILLMLSSCLFGFGNRCMRRRPRQEEKDRMRPKIDYEYAANARKDAEDLEKTETARRNATRNNNSGLPAFPEEEVPLTGVPRQDYDEPESEESHMQTIAGVGTGYRREPAGADQAYPTEGYQQPEYGPRRQQTSSSAAEPFVSMYDGPQQPYSEDQQGYAYGDPPSQRQQMTTVASPPPASLYNHGQQQTGQVYQDMTNPYSPARSPTYPPTAAGAPAAVPSRSDVSTHSNARSALPQPSQQQYEPNQQYNHAQPWIPPVDTRAPILLHQGESSFYSAAQASRDRQSVPANESAHYNSHTPVNGQHRSQYSLSGHRQNGSQASWQARQPSLPAAQQPFGGHVQSPPYDVYEHYQTDSPQGQGQGYAAQPPSSIPFVAERTMSPTPTYGTQDPYPTYGGNVRR